MNSRKFTAMFGRITALGRPDIALRLAIDGIAIVGCIIAGLWIAGWYTPLELIAKDTTLWLPYLLAIALLQLAVNFFAFGIYTTARTYRLPRKLYLIISGTSVTYFLGAFVLSFSQTLFVGKMAAYLIAWALTTFLLCAARLARYLVRREVLQDHTKQMSAERENCVLVIGGAGYIGSALVPKLLERGYRVVVLDKLLFGEGPISGFKNNPNVDIIREDFRDIGALVRLVRKAGLIVHLGGLVGDPACAVDPEMTVDINVSSTRLIGEIARANGISRFVFASSCSVYGASSEIVDEDSRFNPQSLYARSKVASEAVLSELHDRHFSPTCLRFGTIYGLSGRTRFDLVANLLCAMAVRDGKITVFNGDQWRPFVHVDDVAEALLLAIRAPLSVVANQAFNVGSNEQNMTLRELGQKIHSQVPSAKLLEMNENADPRDYRVNFDRINRILGFKPRWSIEDGIRQVVEAIRSNKLGDYNDINFSNVLSLRARGTKDLVRTYNSGWEQTYLELSDLDSDIRSVGSVK